MDLIEKVKKFISYWYIRYLLATELYMVETWERIAIHIVFGILFGLFWFFNYYITISAISRLRGNHGIIPS
ncbi:uncharacterized protein LOC101740127 [Bombyx mori]|uniref:Uncharacterized protein n=1 Tax=Bombyx mori TaxID=7091 RepID=A0A8R1WFV9_BOMMO|nr:uncharacterized protein LOC101740127 [Bombyx mori]